MAKKAVAKTGAGGLPASIQDQMDQYSGAGGEEAGAQDMMIPYINILQALSPQVNKRDGAYVEGAEQGMVYNSASEAIFDGEAGIKMIPVHYTRRYTEWVPRSAGGGLVGERDESIMLDVTRSEETGRDTLPNGNEIVTSGDWFILLVTETGVEQAILSFSGTQMKKSRKLMTQLKQLTFTKKDGTTGTQPFFASVVNLTTVPESNDKGDWFGWSIHGRESIEVLDNAEQVFGAAAAMYEGLKSGTLKAAAPTGNRQGGGETDADIPF